MLEFFLLYDRWGSLITIACGVYASLIAYRFLPRRPKDAAAWDDWHRRFGKLARILGPVLAVLGCISLLIALNEGPSPLPARRVFVEIGQANAERAKRGEAAESYDRYVADLRRIDLSHAPQDLRQAVDEYVGALEAAFQAARSGQPTEDLNRRLKDAHQRLAALRAKLRFAMTRNAATLTGRNAGSEFHRRFPQFSAH